MISTQSKLYKPTMAVLAGALLVGACQLQGRLNRVRGQLGFTRVTPLQNAPPVLVFTTVVLGGFRGLIANALWVRAMELQDEDKFFEMVQLADWITKLQPHMVTVWIVQAWNMSYNISIKFSDPPDRWLWVQRGIELLRDEAIKYNPHEVLLYRELAWQFQHKIGANLDDAHAFYKNAWALEMQELLGAGMPRWSELTNPKTPEAAARVERLRDRFKLDPARMQAVDSKYGPLDWRLPETQAIYWAEEGLRQAKKKEDLITLYRVLYQSMDMAFHRGRLVENQIDHRFETRPNLEIAEHTDRTYEQVLQLETEVQYRDNIRVAHRNFLLDAIYFLYTHARYREANRWLQAVRAKYPDKAPKGSLDDYALQRVGEDIGETDYNRIIDILEGLLLNSYYSSALDEDDQANGYEFLAQNVWRRYQSKIVGGPSEKRVGLPPLKQLKQEVLDKLLDPDHGFSPDMAARLRTKLGLSAATNAPPGAPAPPNAPKGAGP